jgi:hypothetical protein
MFFDFISLNRIVLTTAKCLRNQDPVSVHLRPTVSHTTIRVQIGKYEVQSVNLKEALRVSEVYIHPDFLSVKGDK